MQHLIKQRAAVNEDPWQLALDQADNDIPDYSLLPLALWQQHGADLIAQDKPVGLAITEADDVHDLADSLQGVKQIAIVFSRFADGRGFTQARLLRQQFGYTGELRAAGDVLPDQATFLLRCGFDAICFRSAAERTTALSILDNVSVRYQSDSITPLPLFRRRQ